MYIFVVKVTQLLRTILQLLYYRMVRKTQSANRLSIVIGSNYGRNPDPNSEAIASYYSQRGFEVIWITCNPRQESNIGRITFLSRGSSEAVRALAAAKACFYTHSLSDLLPQAHICPSIVRFTIASPLVFLQHGVVGLKSKLGNGRSLAGYFRSLGPTMDYIVVSSHTESKIVISFGVPENKILLCGLPRYDTLSSNLVEPGLILVFFSWSLNCSLARKYNDLSESKFVADLARRGYSIVHKIHNMSKLPQQDFLSELPLSDLVKRSQILITDDSSLAWDFFLSGREVIFYQPESPWSRDDYFLRARVTRSREGVFELLARIEAGTLPPPELADFVLKNCCEQLGKKLDLVA